MSFLNTLAAALRAIPELVSLLRLLLDRSREINAGKLEQEITDLRSSQRQIESEMLRIKTDEDRLRLARRLSELERR